MTYVLGRPTMKMKPMLGDETEARIPGASFAAVYGMCYTKLSVKPNRLRNRKNKSLQIFSNTKQL